MPDIPRALESYPSAANQTLASELATRVQIEPFNALATVVFVLAILHTFAAARFTAYAHRVQHRLDHDARAQGRPPRPSMTGTPKNISVKSYSPSIYAAQGTTRCLFFRIASAICAQAAEGA